MHRNWRLLICVLTLFLIGQACRSLSLAGAPGEPEPTEMPDMGGAPEPEFPIMPLPTEGIPPMPTMTAEVLIPGGGGEPTPMPALLESRALTLEWPPRMRAGDGDSIRLTLEVDDSGLTITPTAEIEGHATALQAITIPNLYDTHNVLAEARLDLAGMIVQPAEIVSQSLLPGQSVTFYWSIRPSDPGWYRGRVWLYLRFLPLDGGPDSSRVIAAPPVEIEAVTLLGLRATTARWIGALGSVIGTIFSVPFLEDILRWLGGRKRR